MQAKKRSLAEVAFRPAPNRNIGEFFSGQTFDAQGVTFRIVDMLPASQQEPRQPHAHPNFEEVIFVLNGRGKFWTEGEWCDVTAGDAVLVPAGTLHATFNATEEPLRLACFFPSAAGVDQVQLADYKLQIQ